MTDRLTEISRILERQEVEVTTPRYGDGDIEYRILGIDTTARAIMALVDVAVQAERSRCAEIVQSARFGEIDGDFRSIIHRIENPEPPAPEPQP